MQYDQVAFEAQRPGQGHFGFMEKACEYSKSLRVSFVVDNDLRESTAVRVLCQYEEFCREWAGTAS